MSQRVKVVGAPGYVDFEGDAVPGLHRYRINDACPVMSVILPDLTPTTPHVIQSEFVFDVEEESK
jgi:hypothetical protein